MPAQLSSGDVERVLIHMAMVAPDAVVAFRARLKHLQRLGIPLGANTGKGRRVPHTLDTMFQLVIAVDLLQVGLPPQMVFRTIKWNWAGIARALLLVSVPDECLESNQTEWPDKMLFFVQSPSALESLMDIETPEKERWYDDVQIVHAHDLSNVIMQGDRDLLGPGRSIVLNLQWLVSEALGELASVNPDFDILEGWKAWRATFEERHHNREIHLVNDTPQLRGKLPPGFTWGADGNWIAPPDKDSSSVDQKA